MNGGYLIDKKIAFVPVPNMRAFWWKVHPCVLLQDCTSCDAKAGEPCKSRKGNFVRYHHHTRTYERKAKR